LEEMVSDQRTKTNPGTFENSISRDTNRKNTLQRYLQSLSDDMCQTHPQLHK